MWLHVCTTKVDQSFDVTLTQKLTLATELWSSSIVILLHSVHGLSEGGVTRGAQPWEVWYDKEQVTFFLWVCISGEILFV